MADPFKHPDTGIYYIRRKVPLELRAALGREFKRSLKTRDPLEAKYEFARAWAVSEEAFAAARAALVAQPRREMRVSRSGSYASSKAATSSPKTEIPSASKSPSSKKR